MKPVVIMACAAIVAWGCSTSAPLPDKPAESAATAVGAAPSVDIPEFVPGVGIGPVRIGMTRADVEKLGLPVKPGAIGSDLSVGPYVASFDGERVATVSVELRGLPRGAKVGGAVFQEGAKIEQIAHKLQACGDLRANEGANVIACESGRALLLAAGPPGIVSLRAVSPERAANSGHSCDGECAATFEHPGMKMSFSYPQKLLRVAQKPDGATLTSEILGTIEDRSDQGKDRPSPLSITISVRIGDLVDVMKSSGHVSVPLVFPKGTEASFVEQKGFAERIDVAGARGYRVSSGSHDAHADFVYASLAPRSTLEVTCSYVGDMAKPKVPMATQREACSKVLSTLSIKR